MCDGVAHDCENLTAAMIMMPPFLMRTTRIVTVVHVVLPGLAAGVERWYRCDFANIRKFGLVAVAAKRAVKLLHGLTRKD